VRLGGKETQNTKKEKSKNFKLEKFPKYPHKLLYEIELTLVLYAK